MQSGTESEVMNPKETLRRFDMSQYFLFVARTML